MDVFLIFWRCDSGVFSKGYYFSYLKGWSKFGTIVPPNSPTGPWTRRKLFPTFYLGWVAWDLFKFYSSILFIKSALGWKSSLLTSGFPHLVPVPLLDIVLEQYTMRKSARLWSQSLIRSKMALPRGCQHYLADNVPYDPGEILMDWTGWCCHFQFAEPSDSVPNN